MLDPVVRSHLITIFDRSLSSCGTDAVAHQELMNFFCEPLPLNLDAIAYFMKELSNGRPDLQKKKKQ